MLDFIKSKRDEEGFMKIGIISDVHGNFIALEKVIQDMRNQDVEKVAILGYIVIKGPMPKEVINTLKELDVIGWIKGNTDMWFEEITDDWVPSTQVEQQLYQYYKYAVIMLSSDDLSFIKSPPLELSFSINGISVLCVQAPQV